MLPDNLELPTPQKKEWPLIPADVYQTEITNIEYKTEPNRWKQKSTDPDENQIMNIEFTIIEEGPLYGRRLWQKMTPIKLYPPQTKGKESWVYRLASAMSGHPITQGEADQFTAQNTNDYYHGQVRVTVKHSEGKDGRTWNNVESFLPVKTELPPFDEAKVPKENLPADATELTGRDKAKAVADSLPGARRETVAPDIAEETKRLEEESQDQMPTVDLLKDDPFKDEVPFR